MIDFGAWVDVVEPLLLLPDQATANFDDIIACPFVHHWVIFLEVVQDVHGQCSVPSTDFINNEVFIREILEEVL